MGRLMILAGLLATSAAVLVALIWMFQRRLMYFPFQDVPAAEEIGLDGVEAASFETADGVRLNAWFVRAPGLSPRPSVLVLNGNAGNRALRAPLAAALRSHGLHVLLTDYRGYGGNAGTPTEAGLVLDAAAARAYLAQRADVDASKIVYFGESLGTAVAVRLAEKQPPAALILRSPFTSMIDIAKHHYPFLPVRLLLRDRFETADRIRRMNVPVLVIAGGRDSIVPVENSRRLYEAASEPKRFVLIGDADHNDLELLAGREMVAAILRFIGSPSTR
jgi:fermentation-respiration switch protein FrsA (DUF1100 family)